VLRKSDEAVADAVLENLATQGDVDRDIVRGAAVAGRRIKLSLDRPLQACGRRSGAAASPPEDPAKVCGLIGIILALLPWVLMPTGLLFSWVTELF